MDDCFIFLPRSNPTMWYACSFVIQFLLSCWPGLELSPPLSFPLPFTISPSTIIWWGWLGGGVAMGKTHWVPHWFFVIASLPTLVIWGCGGGKWGKTLCPSPPQWGRAGVGNDSSNESGERGKKIISLNFSYSPPSPTYIAHMRVGRGKMGKIYLKSFPHSLLPPWD